MRRGGRWVVGVAVALAVSVLATGGLAMYLALSRRQGGESGADVSESDLAADSRIAFVSDREGDIAIYVASTGGSDVRRVSGSGALAREPSWSPDGRHLAYLAEEADGEGGLAVHIVPVDGMESLPGDEVAASFGMDVEEISRPEWSPDGATLAIASTDGEVGEGGRLQATVHFLSVGAEDAMVVERTQVLSTTVFSLQWSPSGDALLIVGRPYGPSQSHADYRAYLWSEGGEGLTVLLQGAVTADWSPGGEEIVVGDWSSSRVLVMGRDRELVRAFEVPVGHPLVVEWSPDGTRIAVLAVGSGWESYWVGNALHIITLESGELTTILETRETWLASPSWSADGTRLTFTRGDIRRRRGAPIESYAGVWAYDYASGRVESLLVGEGFEGMGVWSP